jgi:hypothetical protein
MEMTTEVQGLDVDRRPDDSMGAHLGMIQGVISRMGSNSFAVKTWAVGLVSALVALTSDKATVGPFVVAAASLLVFCALDVYYHRRERLYRHLYNAVRRGDPRVQLDGPYSMNTEPWEREPDVSVRDVLESPAIRLLYGFLFTVLIVVSVLFVRGN